MQQLKYRYDVEIDNVKRRVFTFIIFLKYLLSKIKIWYRSCIKRVTERDDTLSSKLVILFVSKILSIENGLVRQS